MMDSTRIIHGACPHDCPDGCATIAEVRDGRIERFSADPDHPITRGWLCAKVRPYLDRVYAPDRLLHPLRRNGPKGSGAWEQISWDEAVGEITTRWRQIIEDYGAAAILPYSYSGTLGLVEMSVASSRFWNRMGACGLERSICDAAARVAVEATLGARWAPDPRDVHHTKTLLIWGHNPASTSPHFLPILREAQRNGTYVVVIDPRKTLTAKSADLHIQPRPATDAALALAMINVMFSEGRHDEDWLERHSVGWRELRQRSSHYPVAHASHITGIDQDVIVALARRYARETPSMVKFADGIQRHGNGGQTVRSLLCLPAIPGQYGVRGGGLFYSQSGHIVWDEEAVGCATECPPVPRVVNMNRLGAALAGEISDPPIKSLYVFGANPVASSPNAGLISRGMREECLFAVVHEQFMTDTALLADIVLPATTQLEQTDVIKPYGHQHLQFNHPAIAPIGEAKSNWTVMQLLASGMGYDEPWLHQDAESVIAEIFEATSRNSPALDGLTFDMLKHHSTLPYNLPSDRQIPFADGVFPTPSGKVELKCEGMSAHGVDPLPDYSPPAEFADISRDDDRLMLLSGAAHHFVSSSLANQPGLMSKERAPSIHLHTEDARKRGIDQGDDVRVENDRGWCVLIAAVGEDVLPGVAIAPKGHWPRNSTDSRNVNWLTSDALADLGGQSTFHSTLVRVTPLPGNGDSETSSTATLTSAHRSA